MRIAQAVEARGGKIRVYVQEWQGDCPNSFEVIKVPVTARTNHGKGRQFARWVKNALEQRPADLVVGFNKMPGLDVYYAADVCYEDKVSREKKGVMGFLYRLTGRYKQYSSDERAVFEKGSKTKILLIAKPQIESFQKYYSTEANRLTLLPPGISPDRKYSEQETGMREKFRKENGISAQQFLLLQLGSNFALKGVGRSLKAVASLPEALREKVVFMVVGQDSPTRFEKLASDLGIAQNVRFYPGRHDVPELLAATDVLLHPAYRESAGIVILEAVVAGVPVIVTDTCGYAGHVSEANCGVVLSSPFDQHSLNVILRELLTDAKERQEFAANARLYADKADLYSMIDRAADLILNLCQNRQK